MLLDDAVRYRQAETSAFTHQLGGEKGFKHLFSVAGRNPRTVIFDIYQYRLGLGVVQRRQSQPSGIPSRDTFNRAFAALDPEELEQSFVAWLCSIAKLTAGEAVAIDGKKRFVHMVSVWASADSLVSGQRKVDDESNGITAIPKLLAALKLSGTVVTIDAVGCRKVIAEKIISK